MITDPRKESYMTENAEKIVYVSTHAGEDPERATFPFMMANAAVAMDVEAVVVLQGNSVWAAKKGYAEHVHAAGLPPLKKLMDDLLALGGRILVCTPCIKERHIDESDLIEGAKPVAGGAVTQELLTAKASLCY